MRALYGQGHLGANVGLNRGCGVGVNGDDVGRRQPVTQGLGQYRAVQVLLGAKVVVQIGLGQAGGLGNRGHGGAAKTSAGKHALGCRQNQRLIRLTNLAFGGIHGRGVLRLH